MATAVNFSHSEHDSSVRSSTYEYRTQSRCFPNDNDQYDIDAIHKLLHDLLGRTVEVTDSIAEALFPDEAFGFPINSRFISNFHGSFLNDNGYLDVTNFRTDIQTSSFLNRMISTIATYLRSTKQSPLKNI